MGRKEVYSKNGTSLNLYPNKVVVVMQRAMPNNWMIFAMRGGVIYQSTGVASSERVQEAERLVGLHGGRQRAPKLR